MGTGCAISGGFANQKGNGRTPKGNQPKLWNPLKKWCG